MIAKQKVFVQKNVRSSFITSKFTARNGEGEETMNPERRTVINNHTIHEYYWHGDYPVYVDRQLVKGTYEEVCERIANQEIHQNEEESKGSKHG